MKECPICGRKAALIGSDLREREFKVGCPYCQIYVVADNGVKAQLIWNHIKKVDL